MDRCGGCGTTLLFSARQFGDGLCHVCAHGRLVVLRELVEQVLSEAEPWDNLSVYPVRLSQAWVKKARCETGKSAPSQSHSKDPSHPYMHTTTGVLVKVNLLRTFIEGVTLDGTVHRHETSRELVTESGQRIVNMSCDDHEHTFPLVIHIAAEGGSLQELVRYDR